MQKDIYTLLEALSKDRNLQVEIETNGTMPIKQYEMMENRPSMTMDYKLPSSGMEQFMELENMSYLNENDTVKFVCGTKQDLERAAEVMKQYQLIGKCHIYLSPVFGKIKSEEMVEFMKDRNLNDVNLQLQLHKLIWDPEARGV